MNEPHVEVALQAAKLRIQACVSAAAQRLADTLSQTSGFSQLEGRQVYAAAQFDLRRKLSEFGREFADRLREKVNERLRNGRGGASTTSGSRNLSSASWETLTLVDENEADQRVADERLAQQIGEQCEWELRELDGYLAALLHGGEPDPARNPLRPDTVSLALRCAIDVLSDDPAVRRVLSHEFGRSLGGAMKACYAGIIVELRERGLRPVSLSVKTVQGPGNDLPREVLRENSAYQTSGFSHSSGGYGNSVRDIAQAEQMLSSLFGIARPPGPASGAGGLRSIDDGLAALGGTGPAPGSGGRSGANDARMLDMLRRLAVAAPTAVMPGPAAAAPSNFAAGMAPTMPGAMPPMDGLMAVNVIRQHRDELLRASGAPLDHMVIDVVSALFDQVLSDPKVPPQLARQIARLQMPVLRAALKDVGFFSSRRHPVRRFVNRVASLAAAYEDLETGPGKEFIDRVRALVQEIVDGDFDQMDTYESKLQEIESLIQQQSTGADAPHAPAATLLRGKETELRIQQRYMRDLKAKLDPLSLPEFVRDFLAQVWSQVQVQAGGPSGSPERAQRAQRAARELVMSVQPKGDPQMRKSFLLGLPQLMKDLNEGLDSIRWPEKAKSAFLGQLLPKHAESLKTPPQTDFEQRQLKYYLELALKVPIPSIDDLDVASMPAELPPAEEHAAPLTFSEEEAQKVGLVDETKVDWDGTVDIDLGEGEPGAAAGGEAAANPEEVDIVLDTLSPQAATPTHGPQLIHFLQTGIAYRMHVEGRWQRVRLTWVSPGRAFFVFSHGKAHEKTISMTARMLTRLCETERFRAYEQAELIERATARARKQLAALSASSTRNAALSRH